MLAANPISPVTSARLNEPVRWLEALPQLLLLPGGGLFANLLLIRAILDVRRALRRWQKLLDRGTLVGVAPEALAAPAEISANFVKELRKGRAVIGASDAPVRISRALLGWLDRTIDESSDIAEAFAISADREMGALAKALHDVL
jgi:hypothetical protein